MSVSLPVWPVDLPLHPLVEGYDETWFSQTEMKTPDNGAPMVRRKQVLSIKLISVQFALTQSQVELLHTFVYDTLAGGTYRFSWTHPRTKEMVEMSFYGKDTSSDLITIHEPKGTQFANRDDTVYYTVSTKLIIWP